ncbi:2-methylisocitrate lyase-like PEP mutase family enzyme [Flavobacterium sp. 90]|uniref:isocitrate lyase/PEP mutase family protein n=1 Tax=unclassified Flavobacterium TaxID=196869 RepID=UPI000EB279A4|nr:MULTISPECIES: isocitrate lyase/phosphoenolpyruvate mutase family protein [unclassified Flavobacterium]RKR09284.1 2-methylisocitrate lyase-like PEP mutase family enzyme [Flavobacterium sp. 81]TCK53068.1 2-methylisocitrate lyase-like PEP mutase family enzyme [Flavobacterium sp. 90]
MTNDFQKFKELHDQQEPLLIGNVWNVQSAKKLEELGFKALGTSSYAIAETLGYADGEEMSFDEYLFITKRIAASVSAPLSVDLEAGYGKTVAEIVANIKELNKIGVSGINIEDSVVEQGVRTIVDADSFAQKIKAVADELLKENIEIFINIRSDVFLLGLPDSLNEALKRISIYENIGIHGLFFPCVTKIEDIQALTKATKLPINVMCMPDLPDFDKLQNAGVKRISMGNFLNNKIYQYLGSEVETVLKNQNFSSVF